VVRLEQLGPVADDFIRVRLVRITGVDLNLFDFDYDLTWAAFFLSPGEKVYGRYGGRDAKSADARISVAGLRYAMKAALEAHRAAKDAPPRPAGAPLLAEEYPAAKKAGRGCIHCHQVNEFRRTELKSAGKWNPETRWVFPLPENAGITLEVDEGNKVRAVKPGSPAAAAGLAPGDFLRDLNGIAVASFADAQYALQRAPAHGPVTVSWLRGGKAMTCTLDLPAGWRTTNLTWRPSMLDLLPALAIYGDDLSAAEKQALGLPEKRLAFRQQDPVPKDAQAAGLQAGDVVLGIDGLALEMTVEQFLGYVRQNYLVGDRITLNVVRGGKRIDLPMTLR
jgi:membrane-associated protease RseP (regulator of RpoE activity)